MSVLWFIFYLALASVGLVFAWALYLILATQRIARRAERTVPPAGKFVEIDGNRLHYVEAGEGRPILFLHGLGAQLHQFRQPLFAALSPGYRLIAVDRPGSGYSTRAPGATGGLNEQAEVIARLVQALGLEKPLVVGHSLGGAVALALALKHPDLISGLALLSPLTHAYETVPPAFQPLYIRSPLKRMIIAHTIAVPAAQKYAPQTLAFIFGPQSAPADYMTEGGGMIGLRPSHFYATCTDFVAMGEDLREIQKRYGEIKMPAGLMFGTADQVLDPETQGLSMRGRIDGLEIEIIEGMGHMPQYAETERVTAFIGRMADRAFALAPGRALL
ncbi:alpha/beta hydrolase [Mesorhizobium sp. WSM2239]|jgi:pimeloyl-ACP methyl ester carboxylesterase|uniref:Alpha/beta hydrolase n=2 Tax=unclassified Mesorhizobium TaxID=325217 RepID=A0AAU8D3J5_9HYPH